MQVNQLMDTNHSILDRMVSLFLVMLMLISFIPEPNLIVSAEDNNGGFDLSLSWNSDSNNDNSINPSESFVYNSDKNEERLITLKVKYSNKEVTNGYAAGQIIITVPGLKGAVRSGESYIPVGIAADKVSSTTKIYDWSYSYTETTDTYTFINNKFIEAKSTFEGSFEIMWKLPSRQTINGYSTEIKAELNATTTVGEDQEYYTTESNSISYFQTRERDKYELSEEANYLYKDEVWANEDSSKPDNFDEYTWVSYNISSFDTYLARDVNGSERFDCYFLEGAIVQGVGLIKTNVTRNDFGDGKTYECWSVTKDINDNTQNPCLQNIYVAYPKEYANQQVTNYVELRGTYFDEDQEETLADTSITVNLFEYDFKDIPGDIYDVQKYSYGMHSLYIDNHCNQCSQYGAINSTHLSNGEGTYYSSFKLELNYKGNNADDDERYEVDYYDLEFVDDIMDISLKNGDFKQLSDDEYNFTSIYIPANTEIINKNNLPIKANTYDVKIYLRHANDTFPFQYLTDEDYTSAEPYRTTTIQPEGQEIIIDDDDVVGVKIVVCGVQESFYTDKFRCYYKFHISDEEFEEIITDGGQLINNMYFNLYRSYDDYYEWFNNEFTRNEYSSDREYNRDIQIYGHALDREKATLHILEIPSEFKLEKVELKQDEDKDTKNTFELNGSITSKFTLGEGVNLNKFSMYTIIPSGLKLSEIYNTSETISEILTFESSDDLSSAYIAEHTTIEIEENYKGSGRQYVAIHYDFSDNPITSETITVSNIPMYANKDDFDGIESKSYTMYAGMLIDQQGKWYSTSVDNNTMDNNIWVDMDNDNDIVEAASFNSDSIQIYNPEATALEIVKFVKTSKTNGYVNPSSEEDAAMTYAEGTYSYRLRAKVGETVNAKEFIFFDAIETYEGYEWQGEFVSVDYSFAEQIFGVEPTIYYSTEVETFPTTNKNGKDVYDITPDALKKGNWTTTKPDTVRSIAVYFGGDAIANNKSIFYIDIIMRAPSATVATTNDYYNKITINDFAVGYDKVDASGILLEHENLPSNEVAVKLVPNMGKITLIKKDATDNTTITTGAEFELYRKLDTTPNLDSDELIGTYSTDANGKIIVNNLVYGNYYFKEITAPKGYELSEELLQVELTGDEPDISMNVTFTNERKDGQITIKKVSDRLQNLGLEGAKFSLYKSNGTLVNENLTTDANGKLTVSNLDWGSYYLEEIQAPDGYIISNERFDFTINANNDAGRDLDIKIANEQKPAYAVLTKYEMLEDGEKTINVLSGAVYELYKNDGSTTPIGTYITDKEGKIYAENLTFGEYYFKEITAPKGYELDENIVGFTVGAENVENAYQISAYDQRKTGRVYLQKLDDESEYVKGAVYGLFKGNQQINSFTTGDEGDINIDGLYWGEYYLKEIEAPIGYELNEEEYSFSINADTVSKRIIINATDNRLKGIVELTKYNEDETITLEGAVYTLYKNDGTIYRDNLTTGKDGRIIVEEIDWGSYYFLEKTPPSGYGLSDEKIRFSVNYLTAGKTQQVTATDSQITGKITVTKKVKAEDIVFAHGNPTFTFKVTDSNGNYFYKTVSFSEDYVKNNTGDDGYVQMSVVFTELPVEQTYTVSEVETMRYTTDKVTAQNGTVNFNNTIIFELEDENTDYIANFINKKTTQSGTSHTSQLSNILNRERKLTSVVAIWNGDTYVTNLDDITTADRNINRSLLDVYAIYDDGNQIKLGNDDYTLTPSTLGNSDGSVDGSYTIKVSYTYNGITRTDSFDITIATGECVFTYVTNNDGNDTITITGYKGSSKVLNIPKVIKDGEKFYTVTAVGNGSTISGISGCDTLILPEGLKTIGNNAFNGCSNLECKLNIPSTVTFIGNSAFGWCINLTGGLDLSNVTSIGNRAFVSCSSLKGTLKLPTSESYTAIEMNTFYQCGFTGTLEIPSNIEKIGYGAFYQCTGFTALVLNEGLKEICVTVNGQSDGDYNTGSFQNCTGFSCDLTIPSSVRTIGNSAFGWCSNLTGGLDLSNVTSIGSRAFVCCSSLNGTLKLPTSKDYKAIEMNTFYECGFIGTLEIPSNIEKIGYGAFYNCKGFTALVLNEGLKEICVAINGENFQNCGSFQDCTNFKCDLTIPSSVETIGKNAFNGASGFNGYVLTIPQNNNLKYLGDYAFANCKFDSNDNQQSNSSSIVWAPINPSNIDDAEILTNYDLNTRYYEGDTHGSRNIKEAIQTSELTLGEDPFFGYQLPYGFFERS